MRIAMFTETFLPNANGVTTSIANAREGLRRRGHDVTIFSAGESHNVTDGVHYYGGYSLTSYPDFPLAIYPTLRRPSSRRYLRDAGVEVAHLHGPGPMGLRGFRAAKKNDVPYVYTYHTLLEPLTPYAPRGFRTILGRFATGFQNFLASRAARFIVPSRFLQQAVLAQSRALREHCVVVPTGVDIDRFSPEVDGTAVRESWGFDDDAEVLMYLGRMGFEKRIDFVLNSFKTLHASRPSARLVLAGKGPAMEAFQRQSRSLGLDEAVLFTGYVPEADVPKYYTAADAFVSASDFETQGLTLLEAMAAGAPSAVAAAGGYLDLIREGENAYPFQPQDQEAAVQAMDKALDAPASVGRAARETALEYSVERCIRLLEETYEDVLFRRAR
jgi:1,2-diacylglycerol 3-alpha-glucosyltransferase